MRIMGLGDLGVSMLCGRGALHAFIASAPFTTSCWKVDCCVTRHTEDGPLKLDESLNEPNRVPEAASPEAE